MRTDRLFPSMALAMAVSACGDRAAEPAAPTAQTTAPAERVAGFDGIAVVPATGEVPQVVGRLTSLVKEKGLTVFATVDHQANATAAGLTMRPATVLIFGNPEVGTPIMAAAPTAALDLPQRMLVFQDVDGATKIAYNDPAQFARQHGVTGQDEAIDTMTRSLSGLADAAAKP